MSVKYLPEAVLIEILSKLPVKTLLLCKSVCKSWLNIISSSYFVQTHLHRATIASRNNPTLLAIHNPAGDLAFAMSTLELVMHQPQWYSKVVVDGNGKVDCLNVPHIFAYCRVVGSYNGIICLSNRFGNVVYLWNPWISKCRKIPIPGDLLMIKSPIKIGFGYDSISDDYKVLRIVFTKKNDIVPVVRLYSANADLWREFRAPILNNWKFVSHLQTKVVVNGVLYFDGGDELISFDLHRELLGLVPFPSCIYKKRSYVLDFEGSVAVVFESIGDGLGTDLWTLSDVSGQLYWTKKFSVDPDADSESKICLSCYLGAGKFYGSKSINGMYLHNILYDCEKKETKFYGVREENIYATPLKFVESLVSLDGFEQVE
ncbi:F-box/kelch-repeat protein At3g23880-like [Apium graveolens]|uniref:F-box/kelch-repeat protein At3g23880-like n=1 Tax=Apium graveolens TaxID=4045 RepID=UPI003D7C06C9